MRKEPKIKRQPVESTAIKSAGYDPQMQLFEVEFVSGGIYRYQNVTARMYKEFVRAKSHGKWFAEVIRANKDKYPGSLVQAPERKAKGEEGGGNIEIAKDYPF